MKRLQYCSCFCFIVLVDKAQIVKKNGKVDLDLVEVRTEGVQGKK